MARPENPAPITMASTCVRASMVMWVVLRELCGSWLGGVLMGVGDSAGVVPVGHRGDGRVGGGEVPCLEREYVLVSGRDVEGDGDAGVLRERVQTGGVGIQRLDI